MDLWRLPQQSLQGRLGEKIEQNTAAYEWVVLAFSSLSHVLKIR